MVGDGNITVQEEVVVVAAAAVVVAQFRESIFNFMHLATILQCPLWSPVITLCQMTVLGREVTAYWCLCCGLFLSIMLPSSQSVNKIFKQKCCC
jgi:ABC-type proline/glycine betaine transport system permease subunit